MIAGENQERSEPLPPPQRELPIEPYVRTDRRRCLAPEPVVGGAERPLDPREVPTEPGEVHGGFDCTPSVFNADPHPPGDGDRPVRPARLRPR